jgi:hypothetical protein
MKEYHMKNDIIIPRIPLMIMLIPVRGFKMNLYMSCPFIRAYSYAGIAEVRTGFVVMKTFMEDAYRNILCCSELLLVKETVLPDVVDIFFRDAFQGSSL